MKQLWEKISKKIMMFGITMSGIMYSTLSLAAGTTVAPDPSKFTGKTDKGGAGINAVENIGNNVLGIVSTAASVISVIVLVVLGVKYMMGSAEEKAEYKKTLLPYVIGAVFVFGASAIASVLFSIGSTSWQS